MRKEHRIGSVGRWCSTIPDAIHDADLLATCTGALGHTPDSVAGSRGL